MPAVAEEGVVLEGRDGFPAAYAAHHDWAVRVAYLLCGDRAVAEDVVADAWLGIYQRLGSGPIADVRPYLCRSVVNGLRSRSRRLRLSHREAARPSVAAPPVEPAETVSTRMRVVEALAALPVRMRTAVVLRYYDDLSIAETGAVMGVSEGTVKSSVSKGLARLRELLEDA